MSVRSGADPQINYADPYAALRNKLPAVPQDPKESECNNRQCIVTVAQRS